jgi:cytochrome d ubiquinol oxidase subunit I
MGHLPSALDLARAQFAFVVVWHFLFPAFTIGLASFLAVLEALWLITKRPVFLDVFQYWLRIFSIAFAMGVVSGVVMSYQFGTNWSVFSEKVGPVIGPFLGYEVLTAFFLEAGFLGVMLFGLKRVGPALHFAATGLVAVGTLISTFWILAANSWMQTPAGFTRTPDGRFLPVSWMEAIFNPSFPYRYTHTVVAAYLTTALIVGSVGAFHLLKDRTNVRARLMFSMAMWMATIIGPLQLALGDLHGRNSFEHQPAKVAAMEGAFDTERGAGSVLIGWPDADAGKTRFAVTIPKIASLYLTHDINGEVRGLKAWARADWPTNVPLVFFAFRTMVGLGLLIVSLGITSVIVRSRKRLYDARWLHRWAVAMGPAGLLAVTAGWITTEAGRQPFTVYGLLRTADSVGPVAAPGLAASLLAFVVVYTVVFGAGISFLLHLFRQSPAASDPGPPDDQPVRSAGITAALSVSGVAERHGGNPADAKE